MLVLRSSTIAPADAEAIAADLHSRGIPMLDAPISGGPVRAQAGTLSMMASGSDDAFALARAVIEATTSKCFRIGKRPGDGSRMKIVNNMLAATNLAAGGETMGAAARLGLDLRQAVGGCSVWDASIRKQIKECALFVPIISATTDARSEGYFRLEWKLAVDRSHLLADDHAFLLPVVIDATPQATARVPDRFRERQWSRLSGDETPATFAKRASRLLSGAVAPALPAFSARAAAATSPRPAQAHASICVLPFSNMSGDPEQEYFSDGISEDIITDLSKVSALWVAARNTTFTFKGKHVDVATIARSLNVSHVLEGSVRKAGGRVRITAQLIDGASGGDPRAERYDPDPDRILAL